MSDFANRDASGAAANKGDIKHICRECWKEISSGLVTRVIFIGVLTFLLLVPLTMVDVLVQERQELYHSATRNITASWGQEQAISGPILIIPYQVWVDSTERVKVMVENKEEYRDVVKRIYNTKHKAVLPATLFFDTEINPEVRYRGIYRQALFTAPVDIEGTFILPARNDFSENTNKIYWEQAWVSFGVTDLTTIAETTPLLWNGAPAAGYKPGDKTGKLLGNGFHSPLALTEQDQGREQSFAMRLTVRGSEGLFFTPVGERTGISMRGNWPAPSFKGNLLPTERTVSETGFTAQWNISNLTRSYPQIGDLDNQAFYKYENSAITGFVAGMSLHEPVSLYRMIGRSVGYGILFIAITFTALFAFELICKQRLHILQYGMVGLSMSVFYLLLLSLSEHYGFAPAFFCAAAATVLMNSLYLGSVLRSKAKGAVMGILLMALYATLYSLLNMEDFALLTGSGLVLAMMGALMFATRKLPQATSA